MNVILELIKKESKLKNQIELFGILKLHHKNTRNEKTKEVIK